MPVVFHYCAPRALIGWIFLIDSIDWSACSHDLAWIFPDISTSNVEHCKQSHAVLNLKIFALKLINGRMASNDNLWVLLLCSVFVVELFCICVVNPEQCGSCKTIWRPAAMNVSVFPRVLVTLHKLRTSRCAWIFLYARHLANLAFKYLAAFSFPFQLAAIAPVNDYRWLN